MEGFTGLSFDSNHGEDQNENAIYINNKDWCKPLQASMSRLIQMQPSVCNMILQDASSLKPPRNMARPPRHPKQQQQQKVMDTGRQSDSDAQSYIHENDGLDSGHSTSRNSKLSAWGSNSSIPDLLARQKALSSSRPSSASRHPPRNRPDSAGRTRARPQSAQEAGKREAAQQEELGIKGSRKPVDSRPPLLPRCNSDGGLSARPVTPTFNSRQDQSEPETMIIPPNSPVPEPERTLLDVGQTTPAETDVGVRVSQELDEPVTPQMPESIRFSLPNINDDNDSVDDDNDELDTARLLQQADRIIEKKFEEEQEVSDHLADVNATVPQDEEIRRLNKNFLAKDADEYKSFNTSSCPISRVAAHNSNASKTPPEDNDYNTQAMRSPHVTWSESHTIRLFTADSPSLLDGIGHTGILKGGNTSENCTALDLRQSEQGRTTAVVSNACTFDLNGENHVDGLFHSRERPGSAVKNHAGTDAETFRSYRKRCEGNAGNGFLVPDEASILYKPLEVGQSETEHKHLGGKHRPSSGKKEKEGPDKNDNFSLIGFEVSKGKEKCGSSLTSCLSHKSVTEHQNREASGEGISRKLVPTVTLAYGDEEEEGEKQDTQSQNVNHAQKKTRRRRNFDDVETYMSRLDLAERAALEQYTGSGKNSNCACGDVSCGDLLAPGSSQHYGNAPSWPGSAMKWTVGNIIENSPVVKTTKTIEFSEGEVKVETVNRSELTLQREARPEKPIVAPVTPAREVKAERLLSGQVKQAKGERSQVEKAKALTLDHDREVKPSSEISSTLRPSAIKKQQATESKTRTRPVSAVKDSLAQPKAQPPTSNPEAKVSDDSPWSSQSQVQGGFTPPTPNTSSTKQEEVTGADKGVDHEKSDLEALLHDAKNMALASLMDAAKQPSAGKRKVGVKPKPVTETPHTATPKSRPFSAPLKLARPPVKSVLSQDSTKHKYCQGHAKSSSTTGIRRAQSAKPNRVVNLLSTLIDKEDDSPEMRHAQRMQMKMAAMGVEVDAKALERALFPPSGKSMYYDLPDCLPRNPTDSLIPHYKHWLAEDYRRVKLMEQKLARDDHIKYLQKVAAEKRAVAEKQAQTKKKGKKKGRAKTPTTEGKG